MDRCDECDFEYRLDDATDAGSAIVDGASDIAKLLVRSQHDVRNRPNSETWSPLEYACHVRDVLLVQRERAFLARRVECPHIETMGPNERVDYDGYSDQDPADVARQLVDSAFLFGRALERLSSTDWDRTMVYNYPTRSERSLRWLAMHTLHEVRHHALDISRQVV